MAKTMMKIWKRHACSKCDGHEEDMAEDFDWFIDAQTALKGLTAALVDHGFEVVDWKPMEVQLERNLNGACDETSLKLSLQEEN